MQEASGEVTRHEQGASSRFEQALLMPVFVATSDEATVAGSTQAAGPLRESRFVIFLDIYPPRTFPPPPAPPGHSSHIGIARVRVAGVALFYS